MDPEPGQIPRGYFGVELPAVPVAPARHPDARRGRHPVSGHAQRHAVRYVQNDPGDRGEPPTGRRIGTGPAGSAPVFRRAGRDNPERRFRVTRYQLVATDLDGTLLHSDETLS